MRKYTNRQIQEDSVKEISQFLEIIVKNLVEKSEKLLEYNGTKNQRISKDCIKAVIKSEWHTLLPKRAGDDVEKRKKISLHLPKKKMMYQ